jgi:broad specificity phosphatase PhoE
MSIILIRHGETPLNAARVLQFPDTPLGERGMAQAQAVARRVVALEPVAILSSDMRRAWMTAEAISHATGLPIEPSALLQERNFGDLRGLSFDSLDHDPIAAETGAPNGESMLQFRQRVAQAFEQIVQRRASLMGNLVVVTHGLVIRTLFAKHMLIAASEPSLERLGNTSLSIIAAYAPYQVELLNCTAHLDAASADDTRAVSGV